MKKILAIILILVCTCSLFVGCTEKEVSIDSLEKIEAISVDGFETIGYNNISVMYDNSIWKNYDTGIGSLTLLKTDFTDPNEMANIAFAVPDVVPSDMFMDEVAELFIQSTQSIGNGVTIDFSEIKNLNGERIIYIEQVMEITDEVIDIMIESRILDEATLELAGGREVLTSVPPTHQISMSKRIDDALYTFTGTYYDEAQKEDIISSLTGIMQTLEVY